MSHDIPRELTDVQFVLLGLIFEGEMSGTELRQILGDEYGWDTSTSSFYTYYDRLAKEGYCRTRTTKAGKKFKISAAGKKKFQAKLEFMKTMMGQWKKHMK